MSKKIITTVAALGLTLITQNAHSTLLETEEILKLSDKQKVSYFVQTNVARMSLDKAEQVAFDNIMQEYKKSMHSIIEQSNFIENEYSRVHNGANLGVLYVKSLNDKTKELNQDKIDLTNNLKDELAKKFSLQS